MGAEGGRHARAPVPLDGGGKVGASRPSWDEASNVVPDDAAASPASLSPTEGGSVDKVFEGGEPSAPCRRHDSAGWKGKRRESDRD